MEDLHLLAGSCKGKLFLVLDIGPTKARVEHRVFLTQLVLHTSVESRFLASVWGFELLAVPLLEGSDELLFNHVDLVLSILELGFQVLELRELFAVTLLDVLHFAEQHELFFVNDVFVLAFKHVVSLELVFACTDFALHFFAVKAGFEHVDTAFGAVDQSGVVFDEVFVA